MPARRSKSAAGRWAPEELAHCHVAPHEVIRAAQLAEHEEEVAIGKADVFL